MNFIFVMVKLFVVQYYFNLTCQAKPFSRLNNFFGNILQKVQHIINHKDAKDSFGSNDGDEVMFVSGIDTIGDKETVEDLFYSISILKDQVL
jgi:hypothetical protein